MNNLPDLRAEADRLKAVVSVVDIIGQTVPVKRQGRLWTACCPFHAENTASFYVYEDHYHCFGCGAHGDAFTWVMQTFRLTFPEAVKHLGGVAGDRPQAFCERRTTETVARHADDASIKNQNLARRIWIEAIAPRGTPAETYLQHRGVRLPDEPVIRFHPACPHRGGALPAMIAQMTDPMNGRPCGVHRTFLAPDGSGKAAVDKPKMMLGPAGVIRLDEPVGEGLGLAEGIETALSVSQVIGWRPVWAAGSRGGIEAFPVLPSHCLTVFADGDGPGIAAARSCAARWAAEGREVWIHAAPAGQDWNDAAARVAA
jgi:phage/plasmid primase-like uncharacterized protein